MKARIVVPPIEGWRDQTTEKEREFLKYVWGDKCKPIRGKVQGWLMAIEQCKKRGRDGMIRLLVECQCGKRFYVRSRSFYTGGTTSCGCRRRLVSRLSPEDRMRNWDGKLDQLFAASPRFFTKVKEGDVPTVCSGFGRCLEWIGAKTQGGYGMLSVGPVSVPATHLAWLYEYGEMPTLPVRHTCDNPRCVNVAHLFMGDCATDAYDKQMKNKGAILVEVYQGPYEVWVPSGVNESSSSVSDEGGPDAAS